ncbi:MAG: NAD(P)/FAD-dependent oxidoreductase [Candidatus Helarchaeota archaeon]|nr:NAD(P)/FAD-dependent oxidoreductase [Candidatus Helarchaeota archaeon]
MTKKESYDVIMVGSGIGGSTCAALLAQAGFKTLLLEQNNEVGGACSSYSKEGFIIDTACHLIPVGMKGLLGKILKRCGLKNLEFSTKVNTHSAIRLLNTEYLPLTLSPDLFTSPQPQGLFKALGFSFEEQGELMKVMFKIFQTPKKKIRQLFDEKVNLSTFLDGLTKSNKIKTFLSWINGLMFVIHPNHTSAGEFLLSFQDMVLKRDGSYPIGGCIAIPQAFVEGMKNYGGIVRTNTKVKRILIENDKAVGVELDDGTIITSEIVISNLNIKGTVQKLVGPKYFESTYLKKVNNLEESGSAIVLKIAVDRIVIPNFASVHLFHTDDFSTLIEKFEDWYFLTAKGKIPPDPGFMVPIPSNIDPNLAPPGKQLLIFGSAGPITSEKQNWDPWIKKYYEAILDFHPEIDDYKIFMDVTTPSPTTGKIPVATNLSSYTGKAPVEATALNPDQSGKHRISSQLPIEGLFVVGDSAGTDTHGIGTQIAADSGWKCAEYIISKYKLQRKLAQ